MNFFQAFIKHRFPTSIHISIYLPRIQLMEEEAKKSEMGLADTVTKLAIRDKFILQFPTLLSCSIIEVFSVSKIYACIVLVHLLMHLQLRGADQKKNLHSYWTFYFFYFFFSLFPFKPKGGGAKDLSGNLEPKHLHMFCWLVLRTRTAC